MRAVDTARATPAATGRGPEGVDRHRGAIGIPPTTPTNSVATTHNDYTAYLLTELRCASLRAQLTACEVDSVGIALRAGWIDAYTAIEWLADEYPDALAYLRPTPQEGGAT
jgi:hypothetical protein